MPSQFKINTNFKKMLADTYTPVSIYLKLRDKFANSILLESSDYHGNENSYSFICFDVQASIKIEKGLVFESFPDNSSNTYKLDKNVTAAQAIQQFSERFDAGELPFKFITNGLFGYMSYDSVQYFEDITFEPKQIENKEIPEVYYNSYKYVIAINHFNNELYIFDHQIEGLAEQSENSGIEYIESLLRNRNNSSFKFQTNQTERSNFSNEEFLEIVTKGKEHCKRGDVFQVVFSREFSQSFAGDEFNVYRALRSINPSPYLFFFDFGNFKLFGSSPEAQIVIKSNKASIFPIAGTFKRTGNDLADAELAEKLKSDPKENAEHVMLVDLARNDLSKNSNAVHVETYREVQYFSHVIHLVSKVSGNINPDKLTLKVVGDSFPAGTLSGAPKHKAMQLIDKYENSSRIFYGGCIGFMGFNGDFNHAIMIRSFFSKNNTLYYRAGAGVVINSIEENELQEVNNKLLALRKAVEMAEQI